MTARCIWGWVNQPPTTANRLPAGQGNYYWQWGIR